MELGRHSKLPVFENFNGFTDSNSDSGKDARNFAGNTGASDRCCRCVGPRHTAEEPHQTGNPAGEKSGWGIQSRWRTTEKLSLLARFAFLFFFATAAYGQTPSGPQPFDFVNEITTDIVNLVTAQSGILLHYGRIELSFIAVFGLTGLALRWQFPALNLHHHQPLHIAEIYEYLVKLAFVSMLMTYYVQPIPGTGISLNHLFSAIAELLTSGIDVAVISQLVGQLHQATHGLQHPGFFNLFDTVGYYLDLVVLSAIEVAALLINIFGFVAAGILVLFGPLFIPLFLTKRFERWFWRWVDNLFTYSMYRVIAIAISFLYSSVILSFFNKLVAGNYSLGHMLALLPLLLLITWSYLYSVFKIPSIASMLFSGAGTSASELTGAAIGFLVKGLM